MPPLPSRIALFCAVLAILPASASATPILDLDLDVDVDPSVTLTTPSPGTPTPTPALSVPTVTTPAVPVTTPTVPVTTPAVPLDGAGEMLVRFRPGTPEAVQDALSLRAGAVGDEDELELHDTVVLDLSGDVAAAVRWMAMQPQVEWAEPNRPVQADVDLPYQQGDPLYGKQWAIENYGNEGRVFDADVDALESWVVTKGASGVVGVVDTGVDSAHPDLAGKLLDGANFVPDGHETTADGSGHGTHVTGIIAAVENSIGTVGAAPAARVQPLRALDDTGAGTSATIASAFAYAGKAGLKVVNASLGSSGPSRAVTDAIGAYPNTLFVVAAGNAGVDIDTGGGVNFPCQYDLPNILCVGATDDHDRAANFSNRGASSVDLFAPGASIISTAPGNSYRYESGTSMATPFAASVAAQVAVVHPSWNAVQIKQELMSTVDQPSSLAGLSVTGGRLNAARAVGLYAGPDGQRPSMVTGLVGTAGVGSATLSWSPASSIDLELYQVEILRNGSWTQLAVILSDTGLTSFTLSGLAAGVPQSYRVRAIDTSGEEGDASAPVVVTPLGAAADPSRTLLTPTPSKAATKSAKEGTATAADDDAAGIAKRAVLSAVKRAKAKGKIKGLTFRLSVAGDVTVTAVKLRPGVKAESALVKTIRFAAGATRLKFGGGSKAVKLSKGTWKITLATKASSVSLKIVVR